MSTKYVKPVDCGNIQLLKVPEFLL